MQNQMNKYRRLKNLFLRQSYLDAWEDYQRSILKKSFPKWDYIVLTASNEEQGKAFQKQIEYRSEKGVLPDATKFLVIPDPEGQRCMFCGRFLSGKDFWGIFMEREFL